MELEVAGDLELVPDSRAVVIPCSSGIPHGELPEDPPAPEPALPFSAAAIA